MAGGTIKAEKNERVRTIRFVVAFAVVFVCVLVGIFVALRYFRAEQPQVSFACAAKLYSPYDSKNLEQCMAVCIACRGGVKTTCSTSCTLNGAR